MTVTQMSVCQIAAMHQVLKIVLWIARIGRKEIHDCYALGFDVVTEDFCESIGRGELGLEG